jgi:hypothetical protein
MELLVNSRKYSSFSRRRILPLIVGAALVLIFACGEKMNMPTETPPTGNLGDTLYLMLNPPWDAAHGYDFSQPTCIYFGKDTYLYVADTGNNRILQLDAAGTVHDQFPINNPISISQDELMRLLVVTGEKKVYRINLGPGGDRVARVAFDYDVPQRDVVDDSAHYFFKLRAMIAPDDRFVSITDVPPYDKSYLVAISSAVRNNGRIMRFQGFSDNFEYTDSIFDRLYWNAAADTFINPVIITGNGVTTTNYPHSIYAYELSGSTHLIVCQDSGSYPVHDFYYMRQVWDQHWIFNYSHMPGEADILRPGLFDLPQGATVDLQGNIYVVDSGPDRYNAIAKFSKQGSFLKAIDELYTVLDISDAGGPVYNWIDINPDRGGGGVATGLMSDSSLWVPLGMTFNFYYVNYDRLNIGSNGWCNFLTSSALPQKPAIPGSGTPNAVVAAYGYALNASDTGSGIYYWRNPATNEFIVQYDNIPGVEDNYPKTFQIILDPRDSSITFQYKSCAEWNESAVVGIESSSGADGLSVNAAGIQNNFALKFQLQTKMMRSPSGITYDIYGDRRTVFVADTGNNRILRFKLSTDLEP